MSAKLVVVLPQREYWVICRKHNIRPWWHVIDSDFTSKHCRLCCKACWYADNTGNEYAPICEDALYQLYDLIYYFREKGGISVPNPFHRRVSK